MGTTASTSSCIVVTAEVAVSQAAISVYRYRGEHLEYICMSFTNIRDEENLFV